MKTMTKNLTQSSTQSRWSNYELLQSDIIAGDKHGNGVAVGDVVKVSHRKELYKIHKIIEVNDGNNGESYPIYELDPLHHQTIFRGEHQIELV